MMDQMKIGRPSIHEQGETARWSVEVEAAGLPASLWYEVPLQFRDLLSERADPALIALLIPAMGRHAEMVLEGTVTDELAYRVPRHYQWILERTNTVSRVAVRATDVAPALPRASGVATGFSAGIDSFAALADHFYDPAMGSWGRVTHLIYNNNGSHGRGGRDLWRARYTEKLPVAERLGLPLVTVDSNLDDFYAPGSHQATHTPRDASVAHLLSHGIGRWIYASAYTLPLSHVSATYDTAYSEPFAFPTLSSSAIQLSQHGEHLTRVEKTANVADLREAQDYLDVCVNSSDGSNCSRCPKCLRTLLTLEVLGKLDLFDSRFDLDVYRSVRESYIGTVLVNRDPFSREIRELIRTVGFPVPASAYRAIGTRYAKAMPRKAVRAVRRLSRKV